MRNIKFKVRIALPEVTKIVLKAVHDQNHEIFNYAQVDDLTASPYWEGEGEDNDIAGIEIRLKTEAELAAEKAETTETPAAPATGLKTGSDDD